MINIFKKGLILHKDERGHLYEILRSDDRAFIKFGQLYSNLTKPGAIRLPHKHLRHTDYICVVSGEIKLLLVKENSDWDVFELNQPKFLIEKLTLSAKEPTMVTIPPNIYHGWKALGKEPAITVSVTTEPFDPNNIDAIYLDSSTLNYDWT